MQINTQPFKLRILFALTCVCVYSGCGSRANVQCVQDENCNLSSGGVCLSASTGNRWCAYPDSACPSGLRFSNDDVGDSVGGTCTLAFTLSLSVGGSAPGSVASSGQGFSCTSGTCTKSFPAGAQLELTASSTTGAFLGWSDSCHGYDKCVLTMDQDRTVGALFGIPGQALWVRQGGSSGDDFARAIATDNQNNLIVAGEFRGSMQIGTKVLQSAGGSDVFVAKLDAATGNVVWAKGFGGTGDDVAKAVAVDDAGGIYFTGTFNGSIDFGGGPVASAGNVDAFIAKLNSAGDYVWARGIGGPDFDAGNGVVVRGNTVVVVGSYQTSMTLNGTPVTSAGSDDMFMVELDTCGNIGWAKAIGGPANDDPNSVTIDSKSNVVVVGRFGGPTNFGGETLTTVAHEDVFVAKYAGNNGAHLFSKGFGGAGFESGTSVAVDSQDSIFIMGYHAAAIDVGGPTPLPQGTGTSKMFVVKYSLAGSYLWADSFGDPASVLGLSIATDAAGDLAVTGQFCGTTTFGGASMSSVRPCSEFDWDIFAVRLSGGTGKHINSNRAGGTGLDVGYGVTQVPDGRTFVAGVFQGFAEFGGQGVTSDGGYDAIVLGLAPL